MVSNGSRGLGRQVGQADLLKLTADSLSTWVPPIPLAIDVLEWCRRRPRSSGRQARPGSLLCRFTRQAGDRVATSFSPGLAARRRLASNRSSVLAEQRGAGRADLGAGQW